MGSTEKNKRFLTRILSLLIIFTLSTTLVEGINNNSNEIYDEPRHPYTMALMESVPQLDQDIKKKLVPIQGQPPDLSNVPEGCSFHPRCKYTIERCRKEIPKLVSVGRKHEKACWVNVK